jgi:hypothetical protein
MPVMVSFDMAIYPCSRRTSTLAQLLNRLGQWPPANLLQLFPTLDLAIVVYHIADVSYTAHAVGVSVRSQGGREGGASSEHEGKASPCSTLAISGVVLAVDALATPTPQPATKPAMASL